MTTLIDLAGRRFERLVVVERVDDYILSSGRRLPNWRVECDCGTVFTTNGQNLRSGQSKSCGCLNRELMAAVGKRNRRAGRISYSAAHRRVRKVMGRAPLRSCADCGNQAREWSYNHDDPDEWYEADRRGHLIAYSGDPNHYSPRCKPCHQVFDNRE